jgi:hypothetical protein
MLEKKPEALSFWLDRGKCVELFVVMISVKFCNDVSNFLFEPVFYIKNENRSEVVIET